MHGWVTLSISCWIKTLERTRKHSPCVRLQVPMTTDLLLWKCMKTRIISVCKDKQIYIVRALGYLVCINVLLRKMECSYRGCSYKHKVKTDLAAGWDDEYFMDLHGNHPYCGGTLIFRGIYKWKCFCFMATFLLQMIFSIPLS